MADVIVFKPGGYRYIKEGFQFSSGVAAEPGFIIERARLARPLPLAAGFAAVEAHLAALGRATTAFAACELRPAAPFTEQGFQHFKLGEMPVSVVISEAHAAGIVETAPAGEQPLDGYAQRRGKSSIN